MYRNGITWAQHCGLADPIIDRIQVFCLFLWHSRPEVLEDVIRRDYQALVAVATLFALKRSQTGSQHRGSRIS